MSGLKASSFTVALLDENALGHSPHIYMGRLSSLGLDDAGCLWHIILWFSFSDGSDCVVEVSPQGLQ
jgi:hypothetical protein